MTTCAPLLYALAWQDTDAWHGWVVVEREDATAPWRTMDDRQDIVESAYWAVLPSAPPGLGPMGVKPQPLPQRREPEACFAVWVGMMGRWGDGNVGA